MKHGQKKREDKMLDIFLIMFLLLGAIFYSKMIREIQVGICVYALFVTTYLLITWR